MTPPPAIPDFEVPAGTIIVLGDSRPRDYFEFFLEDSRKIPREVFETVAAERPAAIVHCGDLAVFGSQETFWQGWSAYDQDVRPVIDAGIPLFPVPGNHEYRGGSRSALDRYFARFPHLLNKRFYTLRSGTCLFVVLDSNFGPLGPASTRAQEEWLKLVLALALADERVVHVIPVVHHPPFTNISRRYLVFESSAVQRRFVPDFVAHPKIALVFAGHVHTYEHIFEHGKHFIVTGGGGSPRFVLRPAAKRRRIDLYPDPGRLRPFHYLRLLPRPEDRSLDVEVVGRTVGGSWSVRETFELPAASS